HLRLPAAPGATERVGSAGIARLGRARRIATRRAPILPGGARRPPAADRSTTADGASDRATAPHPIQLTKASPQTYDLAGPDSLLCPVRIIRHHLTELIDRYTRPGAPRAIRRRGLLALVGAVAILSAAGCGDATAPLVASVLSPTSATLQDGMVATDV